MPERKNGPLEWLLHEVGGGYVSDLRCDVRYAGMAKQMCGALRHARVEEWTAAQWADAAGYLTNQHVTCSTQAECVQWLLAYLEKM